MKSDNLLKISAIICTHNSAELLRKAIVSLVQQNLEKAVYEIIVVDNGSTDMTKEVCNTFTDVQNIRYIYEPILGLSAARNKGLHEAKGKYIAYIDDDAIASPQWLRALLDAFEKVQPSPASVGGKILPVWEVPKPDWFPDHKKPYLTVLDYGDKAQFIKYPRILFGTNMAFRKEVLLAIGGFRTDVGRKKNNLLSNEETDIYQKLSDKDMPVYYQPKASLEHLVSKKRLTKNWLYSRHYWQGRSEVLMYPYGISNYERVAKIKSSIDEILIHLKQIYKSRNTANQSMAKFSHTSDICQLIGRIIQHIIFLKVLDVYRYDAILRSKIWKILGKFLKVKHIFWLLDIDVFTRHKEVVREILKYIHNGSSILDVGGRVTSLSTFLPPGLNKKLYVLNYEFKDLKGGDQRGPYAIQGDGAHLPFESNQFDIVSSITTLEHIRKEDRRDYLTELYRVAQRKVVIYVPIGPIGERYERCLYRWSLNDHIKFMTKQHIDNGLPTIEEIKDIFPDCTIKPIQNAYTWLLCMIFKQVPFIGIFIPRLIYEIFLRHLKFKPFYEYMFVINKNMVPVRTTEKKRILIVSRYLPRFDRGSGHVRFMAIIEMLTKRYELIFVAENFSRSKELDDVRYQKKLQSMGVKVYTEKYKWDDILQMPYDIVLFEWYDTAIRNLRLIKNKLSTIPVIIDTVDVHYARELQGATVHNDENMLKNAIKTKQEELYIYKQADLIWAITEEDKRILLKDNPELSIDVISNIHKLESVNRSSIERNTLLFIGNFYHQPNEDAVIFFTKDIFWKIKEIIPDAVLKIVGNAPTRAVKALATDSIQIIGWVPETKPYLEKCHVSIVPLRYGAGMKGKVGEAMAAGVPVVTTSIGIQGMDVVNERDLLVADTPEKFAELVVKILRDDNLYDELSMNARNYMKDRYTPEIVENRVIRSVEGTLSMKVFEQRT